MGERLEMIAFVIVLVGELVVFTVGVVLFVVMCRELLCPMLRELRARHRADAARAAERGVEE